MHKSEIKRFAIWARRTLIQQISQRAALFGLLPDQLIPAEHQSFDKLVIQGQIYGNEEARGYASLLKRLQHFKALHHDQHKPAFSALIDEAAYTWFNRLTALRFMEVNSYLPRRVLSSSEGGQDPDLLRDALQIALQAELPGITTELVDELRHSDDQALYRKLLVAQCNSLKPTLPFLFETISDELTLLLPLNLLNPDSVLRRLVSDIPEQDWQQVEIIGWLYQYYISERKDEVIGAKTQVASADIPAATQLFTPNWIVQYMVQNSLGKLWLESHPESGLKAKMPYYLDTPPQEPEVQAKIDTTKNPNLQPQDLTVMDPACGSGHILVYAFELLTEIYREQGYRDRDIPAMIFEYNLHGLDIDGRAAQLAAFVLMMKARSMVRDVKGLQPIVQQVNSSKGIDFSDAADHGHLSAVDLKPWRELVESFKDAETLGSLLTPPAFDEEVMQNQLANWKQNPNSFVQSLADELEGLLSQAAALQRKYSVVVANPPYMGNKNLNNLLKAFLQTEYPNYKTDLFAASMIRFRDLCILGGHMGFMTPFVWMFIKSYEELRRTILDVSAITNLTQLEIHAIFDLAYVSVCTFTLRNLATNEKGEYIRLSDFYGAELQSVKTLEAIQNPSCIWRYQATSKNFERIPGAPIAYWLSERIRSVFKDEMPLADILSPKQGLATANNDRFLRFWYEVNQNNIGLNFSSCEETNTSGLKWYPYNKGGEFRKWYGNYEYVVNWLNDGFEIKNFGVVNASGKPRSRAQNTGFYFKRGITWSDLTSSVFSARLSPGGFVFDIKGSSGFPGEQLLFAVLGLMSSKVMQQFMSILNPTLSFQVGDISRVPYINKMSLNETNEVISEILDYTKLDWDSFETSWDFGLHPLVRYAHVKSHNTPIESCFTAWAEEAETRFRELQRLEVENNKYWIEAYGLQDELTPDVPDEQITVRRADEIRDIESLLSYALGCIMGRYSLDEPGLIHAGQPFDTARHTTFPADSDGIVPINDTAWFEDDLVNQIKLWVRTVFGETHYSDNLRYLATVLGPKAKESPEDTLRRYFTTQFMKDHHQIYKRRPIYWFFTSGKKRAFNAYVYLHRYSADTLGLLRAEYLHPLQLKLEAELKHLEGDTANAKRVKVLQDQLAEIQVYDEKLKHKAEQRISLDLDDGVAYNYTLFEGLVYEGADLKMADLKAKSQWKHDLLAGKA